MMYDIDADTVIVEKKAPTDESIRLLKEMEDECKNKILNSITVNNTEFECNIHNSRDMLNDRTIYYVTYRMNNKKKTIEIPIQNYSKLSENETALKVVNELAKDIATDMILEVINHAQHKGIFRNGF